MRVAISVARGVVHGALDVLWPSTCIDCGALGPAICAICIAAAPRLPAVRCVRCEGPAAAGDNLVCRDCRGAAFDWVVAAGPYEGAWLRWIRRAKFRPDPSVIGPLALALADRLRREEPEPNWLLVPIPPGSRAGLAHGPHLPSEVARLAAQHLGLGVADLLTRRPGPPQRRRSRAQRRQLPPDTFAVATEVVRTQTVILVDDVMTTGATLAAAAAALRDRWPGLAVGGAVIARTAIAPRGGGAP